MSGGSSGRSESGGGVSRIEGGRVGVGAAEEVGGDGGLGGAGAPSSAGGAPATCGAPSDGGALSNAPGFFAYAGSSNRSLFGDAGAGGSAGVETPLIEGAWNAEAHFEFVTGGWGLECPNARFTFYLSPEGDSLRALLSRDGHVVTATFTRSDGTARYVATKAINIPRSQSCSTDYSLNAFDLAGIDSDGDGSADELVASGTAQASYLPPYRESEARFATYTFAFRAERDNEPPSFMVPQAKHPLGGIDLVPIEPVTKHTRVTLVGEGKRIELTGYDPEMTGAYRSFRGGAIWPFGSVWEIEAVGTDLAGLPFKPSPSVKVLTDPGALDQDGFETSPKGWLVASRRVGAIGSVSPLSGCSSLLIPSGGSATFRLERPATATSLRLSWRALSKTSRAPSLLVDAGTVARTPVKSSQPGSVSSLPVQTGDQAWPFASEKMEFSAALPADDSDVMLLIEEGSYCEARICEDKAVLIDDLRLE